MTPTLSQKKPAGIKVKHIRRHLQFFLNKTKQMTGYIKIFLSAITVSLHAFTLFAPRLYCLLTAFKQTTKDMKDNKNLYRTVFKVSSLFAFMWNKKVLVLKCKFLQFHICVKQSWTRPSFYSSNIREVLSFLGL